MLILRMLAAAVKGIRGSAAADPDPRCIRASTRSRRRTLCGTFPTASASRQARRPCPSSPAFISSPDVILHQDTINTAQKYHTQQAINADDLRAIQEMWQELLTTKHDLLTGRK